MLSIQGKPREQSGKGNAITCQTSDTGEGQASSDCQKEHREAAKASNTSTTPVKKWQGGI